MTHTGEDRVGTAPVGSENATAEGIDKTEEKGK